MEKEIIRVKAGPTKRKMTPEELQIYLREMKRGVGFHSSKKGARGYNRRRDRGIQNQ